MAWDHCHVMLPVPVHASALRETEAVLLLVRCSAPLALSLQNVNPPPRESSNTTFHCVTSRFDPDPFCVMCNLAVWQAFVLPSVWKSESSAHHR